MPVAHVDLDALRSNFDLLRGRLSPACRVLAAVKADGYGHGAVAVARELEAAGCDWFGVATTEEALELRQGGVEGRILLFGPVFNRIPELVAADVALTVPGFEALEAVRASGVSGARLHLKVDTGMGRLGHPPAEALELARQLDREPGVILEGVWTHFARADELDRTFTGTQIELFASFLDELQREGLRPELAHACNSAGLLAYPEAHFEMGRPGISLYGYPPDEVMTDLAPTLKPVMTVTAPVTFVKRVPAGTSLSYGGSWTAERETTIATVRIGYADGYPRVVGNRASASIRGELVKVAGRVCMDQLMIDVGDLDLQPGERVTLFGPEGPTAAELGSLAGTVSYEILTSVGPRVKREYNR
ncbi:MAG TPA: alanine racemase [Trueperaceae bacterium]